MAGVSFPQTDSLTAIEGGNIFLEYVGRKKNCFPGRTISWSGSYFHLNELQVKIGGVNESFYEKCERNIATSLRTDKEQHFRWNNESKDKKEIVKNHKPH